MWVFDSNVSLLGFPIPAWEILGNFVGGDFMARPGFGKGRDYSGV